MARDELLIAAKAWCEQDPDSETRAELQRLMAAYSRTGMGELVERFSGRLKFGTAGLRAELGAGPMRMNRVVVAQTTRGFANFLLERAAAGSASQPPTIVIGFDARKNSAVFAEDIAEIMQGSGVNALLLPGPVPTPVTAFAVKHLNASAGVMVTASHNPPNDNGYKVYLGDSDAGSQIIPPNDHAIADAIDAAAAEAISAYPRSGDYTRLTDAIVADYVVATAAATGSPAVGGASPAQAASDFVGGGGSACLAPKLVYTAMHGVGAQTTERVFAAAGLPQLTPVPEQIAPDSAFPTVEFPNPEEPGALDLAFDRAKACGADAIIAHDPDADRLAVALPDPEHLGEYRALSGNQLGLLLGWRIAEKTAAQLAAAGENTAQSAASANPETSTNPAASTDPAEHTAAGTARIRPALACTIVSSPALGAVAKHYGFNYAETLSGFKWVSRIPGLVFGFEEALGYLVNPGVLRDKDGISAAAEITSLICELHSRGETLWDQLDRASDLFGHFVSDQITLRLSSREQVEQLAQALREAPATEIGGLGVESFSDLLQPGVSEVPANVLRYDLVGGARLMIRPSGTEPKLKLYLDAVSTLADPAKRRAAAAQLLQQLRDGATALLAAQGA